MGQNTIPLEKNRDYQVVVRMLPSGEEVDLELPIDSTGRVIKQSLLDSEDLNIPRNDHEGNAYIYKLTSKGSGKEITDEKSLYECGVNDGDTLLFMPTLIAG